MLTTGYYKGNIILYVHIVIYNVHVYMVHSSLAYQKIIFQKVDYENKVNFSYSNINEKGL